MNFLTAAPAQGGSSTSMIVMLVGMFAIMYFLMIRPQKKRQKEEQAMRDAVEVGDEITTIGGICGKVAKIKDEYVYIETGNVGTPGEKSIIKFERSAIKTVETIHDDQ